jgi:hypothetical protein
MNPLLLILLGGAAYLLTKKPVAAAPYYGAGGYMPGAPGAPGAAGTAGFDSTPVIFNTSPNVTPYPVIAKETSSPTTNLGQVVAIAKEADQLINILKPAAPVVTAAAAAIISAPVVAAPLAGALAAPVAAPVVSAVIPAAGVAAAPVAAVAAPVAAETVLGLGAVATAGVILAPFALAIGLVDLLATNKDNSPAALLATNQQRAKDMAVSQAGYTMPVQTIIQSSR